MSDYNGLLQWVEKRLSPGRYQHTLRVMATAQELARLYGASENEAALAAILHDCARDMPTAALLKQAEAFGIVLADVERRTPALLHALVGAELARCEAGVQNESVLAAVRWHTTGRPAMSVLEQVLFIADYIEPGRDFPGVANVRAEARRSLEESVLLALNQTILYVIQRGWLLHPATVAARNYLLLKQGDDDAPSRES